MPRIDLEIEIAAPVDLVYALAKDVERFPEYMPDVERVEILERDGDRLVTAWTTVVEDATIEWTEEDVYDDVLTRVRYRAIDGDLDRFEGDWIFERLDPEDTRVRLSIEYDFGIPALAELIGPTLDATIRENGERMLTCLRVRATNALGERPPNARP